MKRCNIFLVAVILIFFSGTAIDFNNKAGWELSNEKIKGVNLVAPPNPFQATDLVPLKEIGNEWVSVVPYAYSRPNETFVTWGSSRQWWGEKPEGVKKTILMARENGFKIMLKPHIWVIGQGWAGDFDLKKDDKWKKWEESYAKYVITYAKIAQEMKVEMLCIGTEFRFAATKRARFWKELISDIRKIYSGKLTYAANWDNFRKISFWEELDYIGIDSYFPLSEKEVPTVQELKKKWKPLLSELENYSLNNGKEIIFTEYGYRSIDYTTTGHWKLEGKNIMINQEAQNNAYEALYQSLHNKSWYKGGFLWKWFPKHQLAGGPNCDRFTPQNKLAQETIKKWNAISN